MNKNTDRSYVCRTLLLLLLLMATRPFFAQHIPGSGKDSLRAALSLLPRDTAKVAAFIKLGQQYEYNSPDSAIFYYNQARDLSLELDYPEGIVKYASNITGIWNMQGQFDSSLQLNLRAVSLCEEHQLSDKLLFISLTNTGAVYQYQDDHQNAIACYLKALALLKQSDQFEWLSNITGNLSGIYVSLRQPDKAIDYALQSVEYAGKSKSDHAVGSALGNLGVAYQLSKSWQKALECQQKSYETGLKINNSVMQLNALLNMGDILMRMNAAPERYIDIYKKTLSLARSLDDTEDSCLALYGIAYGKFFKKEYRTAETLALQALDIAAQNNFSDNKRHLYLLLKDISNATGRHGLAMKYDLLEDSVAALLNNEVLQKNIQELDKKYETQKKQAELLQRDLTIEKVNRQTTRQRSWLIITSSGVLLLLVMLLGGYLFYRQRQQLSKKKLEGLKASQKNLRLEAMLEGQREERRRIAGEMHDDISSGLTSMLFLSRSLPGTDETAAKLMRNAQSLIKKMNEIIWAMSPEQDTLDSLIAYTRLHVVEMLDNAGIDYTFTVADPLPALSLRQELRRNIYLVIKEAVHNIIRHADASHVDINIQAEKELTIMIQDDGKGFDSIQVQGLGNGIRNMQSRMAAIGGTLIISPGKGTSVTMDIPLF
ncbi:MAG: sensor histidine kinase [Chitinophagaceae bacterium]|nr:sensor histidine kinase [Chitinophagaceae bacterium]